MNLKRLRDPLVAAVGALLIGGVGVAMAAGPNTPSTAPTATIGKQSASGSDSIQKAELTTPDSPEAAGTEAKSAEADAPGGYADNPNDPNADHQFDGVE